ncbi:hypothetical protein N0V88_007378 [Collariella sp. IMI 366227]|nr:hypothetical protein N0V88_007378 [Collariella sp. IMI 366227]
MPGLTTLILLGTCAVQAAFGLPEPAASRARRDEQIVKRDTASWINTETPIAWKNLLCNIGPSGCRASGAGLGVVIASPSKSNPDYWYTWTRDASLVFTGIVDSFAHNYSAELQTTMQNFIIGQARLQGVSNPSGGFSNGAGLGEPKFMVDLRQFTGEWGRPQRDGPPLRAIALIRYAKWLVKNNYKTTALDVVWPVIKNDLAYTTQYWAQTALVEGAQLAALLGVECSSCLTVAPNILCFQQSFWNGGGYINSNIDHSHQRSGKDSNSVLTSMHNFDPAAGCDPNTFQPCSDRALRNHKSYVDGFRSAYSLNRGIAQNKGVAVGRYTEDVYYGGNPWYLSTFAAAEQLYDAIYVWKKEGSITITALSLPFFKDLLPSIAAGTYKSDSANFKSIIDAVFAYADSFMDVAAKYTPSDGSLTEQFDRNSGNAIGATHLTWSYAAFITAAERRAGIVPDGWGAETAKTIPGSCNRNQVAGSYTSATKTSFPANQTPQGTTPTTSPTATTSPGTIITSECSDTILHTHLRLPDPDTVQVTFNHKVVTRWGQTVKIVGSIPELGNWNTNNAVELSAIYYTSGNPLWFVNVELPAEAVFEYKFINVEPNGAVKWESNPNRRYTVPKGAKEVSSCDGQGSGGVCEGDSGGSWR